MKANNTNTDTTKIELESMFDNAQTMHLQEFINYYTPAEREVTGSMVGGEWTIEKPSNFQNRNSVLENGKKIFVIEHYTDTERMRINTLIKYTPALLDALKVIYNIADSKCDWTKFNKDEFDTMESANALINTIEGNK